MVDTEARQSGDGVSLLQLFQTDGTLPRVSGQDVLVVGEARLAEAQQQMLFNLFRRHELGAERTVEPCQDVGGQVGRQGADEQPVALGGALVIVPVGAIHTLV